MDIYHRPNLFRYLHFTAYLHDRYTELVLSDTFRQLALSLIAFFVPVFLLKSGYSVLAIAVYETGTYVAMIILHFFVLRELHRIGIKRTLVLSYLASILFFASLYNIGLLSSFLTPYPLLALCALLNTVALVFYWSAHHVYFLSATETRSAGAKAGLMACIPGLLSIAGLYTGSVLITDLGFRTVFLVAIALLLAASVALASADPIVIGPATFTVKDVIDRGQPRKNLLYLTQGVNFAAISFIWPVYLFWSAIALTTIGGIYLVSDIGFYLIGLFASRRTDRANSSRTVAISSILHGLTIIGRGFIASVNVIAVWQVAASATGGVLHPTLESEFFKHSGEHRRAAVMNREFYMHLGRIIAVLLFLAAIALLPLRHAFTVLLVFGGLVTMSWPLIDWHYKKTSA